MYAFFISLSDSHRYGLISFLYILFIVFEFSGGGFSCRLKGFVHNGCSKGFAHCGKRGQADRKMQLWSLANVRIKYRQSALFPVNTDTCFKIHTEIRNHLEQTQMNNRQILNIGIVFVLLC